MKNDVKKQLLDIVDTLCTEGRKISEGKLSYDQLLDTLEQCQAGAVAVGTAIEESEGEGTEAVQKLEQFCDLLYETAQASEDGKRVRKLGKVLRGRAVEVQNCIKNNISVQLEVVFLPYNPSMWDSLESIWIAANEDPDCTPYVVPIPYYDKLPDGSFGKMHYDWGDYPDNVPVVSYKDYDIATRRPDMIYFHNPYDGDNLATSVPPEFFASKLRNYTDMLVYVPYFVGINDKVEPHFCVLAGTVYAHKVIVESEAVRDIYIEEYTKFCRDNDLKVSDEFIRNKFLALGSPKLDKVYSSKREDFTIPEEWARLIRDKKVILYNTHLRGIMNDGDKFLKKVRWVLHCFEQRSDVVLWWRPHPLSDATIQSMNTVLWEEYKDTVDEYVRKKTGIYDDTAQLHRAIAYSNAYYGDWSSLVTLYKATGKPIMIQNADIVDEEADIIVDEAAVEAAEEGTDKGTQDA